MVERFRHKHARRVRLAVVRLAQVADVAVLDAEAGRLRLRLGRYNLINIHLDDRKHRLKLEQTLGRGDGIHWEHADELSYRVRYDREQVSSAEIIRKIVNEVPIHDIYIEAEPIEDIIKTIYSRGILESSSPGVE